MEIHSTSNCLAIAELFGRQGINSAKCMYGDCPQSRQSTGKERNTASKQFYDNATDTYYAHWTSIFYQWIWIGLMIKDNWWNKH